MSVEIGHVVQLLDSTLDPQQHRKAEAALRQEEKKPQFCLSLLQIASSEPLPLKTRLAAALCFKNFIRLNYVDEEGAYKLPQDDVSTIKQELVGLMISSPASIQTQLGEAISIIADSDFWERWDTLIDDLVSRLSATDAKVTNGVLEVAHSIFVRWRPLFRSNELFTEINHVLSRFGEPFMRMLTVVDQQIDSNKDNAAALKGWFDAMSLLIKIFYDLSCQDLPPIIESNLQPVTALFQKYLTYSNPAFAGAGGDDDDDDEATAVENVKAEICEVLQLYSTKYDDDFGPHTEPFINVVWNVLSTTGPAKRYDILVSKALQFLTAVAGSPRHAGNFSSEEILGQIVEKVILSNVALRESDIEMFEDEPIEFIRRDLEGSDTDSRRRAATDFLRKLLETYEALVTQVVFRYIDHYLEQGKTDWKAKDTAIYLFLAIAAKGAVTAAQGVKTVNQYVNVVDFFQKHVAADLLSGSDTQPIAKVDAIKYLHTFRSQLTKDQWQAAFQPLIQNLASDNYVVYTYAAIAVERVLFLTNDEGVHLFTREDIQPFAKDLLSHLFSLIEKDTAPAKLQENEFLMRCIVRVLIVIKEGVVPIVDDILTHLINITNVIKSNPSNPRFYYYHFEAVGALVRYSSGALGNKLEATLWEPFSFILKEDVSEFVPYVFQIFSALIEMNPTLELPDHYKTLIPVLLNDTIWETRGNVPACARFLSAILPKIHAAIVSQNQILPLLEIFSRLFASKKTEQNALDILESIITSIPAAALDPYFSTILGKLFTKLDSKALSDSYKIRFVRFYHLVSARGVENGMGADYFVQHANKVTEGVDLFKPIYLNFVLPTTGQFARPVDRKLGVISYTKTLCDSASFASLYEKGWGLTCNYLLDLLKNPPQVTSGAGDEVVNEADVDDIGFGVGYTPLNTCRRGPRDDFPEVENVQQWVGAFFKEADRRHNGTIAQYVDKRLQPEAKAALAPYLA
ncbi:importin-alpha export receptor [Sporothrix curviconia]|uniref:Importin-alpha export receptor n=1 Tax=Sporothrix curviconia TaxID=1260050 RepID=A0ABP0C4X1_9PEZI